MPTFLIEGQWSGYRSSQQRIVHREYTTNKKLADAVSAMHAIRYTDGTCLYLTVTNKGRGKRLPEINGYGSLIRKCAHAGVNSVEALNKQEKQS